MIEKVLAEVTRATKKYPTWPTDPLHALAVLGEEFGELTKSMLQLTYEPHKTSPDEVRAEAIQTAAMALRLVMSIDRYRYAPCHQHSQGEVQPVSAGITETHRFIGMSVEDLRRKAQQEDGCMVSVGGLVTDLEKEPNPHA